MNKEEKKKMLLRHTCCHPCTSPRLHPAPGKCSSSRCQSRLTSPWSPPAHPPADNTFSEINLGTYVSLSVDNGQLSSDFAIFVKSSHLLHDFLWQCLHAAIPDDSWTKNLGQIALVHFGFLRCSNLWTLIEVTQCHNVGH